MAREKNGNGWRVYVVVFGIVLTLAGIVWATAVQWNRLDANVKEDEKVHKMVYEDHEVMIKQQVILEHIKEGVDDIKRDMKAKHP